MTPAEKAAATRAANKIKRAAEAKAAAGAALRAPRVIDCYGDPGPHGDKLYLNRSPTVHNWIVRIRHYRVTVELVDEPPEVLRDRLVTVWREDERNSHHWDPMWRAAMDLLGISNAEARELLRIDDHGRDRKADR